MRIGKAFFENGAEAKPADAEVKTEKVIDKTAAEGTQSGGEVSDDNLTGQDSTNEGEAGADASATEEAPKKGKVGRPAKK